MESVVWGADAKEKHGRRPNKRVFRQASQRIKKVSKPKTEINIRKRPEMVDDQVIRRGELPGYGHKQKTIVWKNGGRNYASDEKK